jgi:iron complex outermembrane recepter protein
MSKPIPALRALAVAAAGAAVVSFSIGALAQEAPIERIEVTGSLIKRIEGETSLPVDVITRDQIQKSGATTVEQLLTALPITASANSTVGSQNAGFLTGGLAAVSLHGLGSVRVLVLINGRRVAPYGVVGTDSTSVDVNSLPLSSIERVEILKEGASALYGSDAIGGVVNFILRRDYQGAEISANYGDSTQGGGGSQGVSLAYGFGDLSKDRFNFMVSGSYQHQDPLGGRDRTFSANGIDANHQLNGYDNTSSNTFPGNMTPIDGSFSRRNVSFPACAPGVNDPNFPPNRVDGSGQCRADLSPYVQSIDKTNHTNIFSSLKYKLGENLTAYAEASYNRNLVYDQIQPSPVSDLFALSLGNPLYNSFPYNDAIYGNFADGTPQGNLAAALATAPGATASSRVLLSPVMTNGTVNAFYPFAYVSQINCAHQATQPCTPLATPGSVGFNAAYATANYPVMNVRYRTYLNGGRSHSDSTETPRFTLGLNGTVSNWDFDVNVLHSSNSVTESTRSGYWVQSKLLPILNSSVTPGSPYNLNLMYPYVGASPGDAATMAAVQAANFNGDVWQSKVYLDSVNGKISGDLFKLPGGTSALAVGAEVRRERYELGANPYLATGDISGYGGNVIGLGKQRNVYAGFFEFDAPILKYLEANVAARFDHYEGTGSKTSPKFSLRFQPISQVLVRASISKGFRAPSLTDLYAPLIQDVTATITDVNDCVKLGTPPVPTGFGCNQQYNQSLGGNSQLKPERSTNLSLGIVLQPTKNISFAIDYFDIKIKDVIAQGGIDPSFILSHQAQFGNLITRGGVDPALPAGTVGCPTAGCTVITQVNGLNINVGSQRNQGFDFDGNVGVPMGEWGKASFGINATYFQRVELQNPDGSYTNQIDTADETLSNTGGIIARWRHRAFVDWVHGDWDLFFVQNYQGSYLDSQQIGGTGNNHVDAYYTYDASVQYTGFKKLRLGLGVKNLANQDPPFTGLGGSKWFQNGYDPSYGDPLGRFIYGTLTYQFK